MVGTVGERMRGMGLFLRIYIRTIKNNIILHNILSKDPKVSVTFVQLTNNTSINTLSKTYNSS